MDTVTQSAQEIERIVADILASMSLKEKALIANMDEKSLPYLQYAFDVYISREVGDDANVGQTIMRRVWRELHDTYRIRLVDGNGSP